MPATNQGAAIPTLEATGPLSESEGENLFLQHFLDSADAEKLPDQGGREKKKHTPASNDSDPSEDANDEAPAEELGDDEESEQEDETEGEDDADGADKKKKTDDDSEDGDKRKFADDDVIVKIKVGDKEHQVPVRELQRLYGQEAALTRKSMEVATQRKAIDASLAKAELATTTLLDRARQAFEPYSKIDFIHAAQVMAPEQLTALRNEAMQAFQQVQFLEGHLNKLVEEKQTTQKTERIEQAKKSLAVLQGPVADGGIQGFNEKTYTDICSFAVKEGMDPDIVNAIVDPAAIRMIHDAMQYRRGLSKVITKKVNKTPKKVIKTTASVDTSKQGSKAGKVSQALKRVAATGRTEDAEAAFLARWETTDQD